jgi:hypothetical protein
LTQPPGPIARRYLGKADFPDEVRIVLIFLGFFWLFALVVNPELLT